MNYLAHAYLSFNHPEVLAGNMISDFIKGKQQFNFPDEVRKGIRLHRLIDSFTDSHPVNREAKAVFRADYGLYSGAFHDIVYDHFLATDAGIFPADELGHFAQSTYSKLDTQIGILPDNFLRIFPYMKNQNWLLNYRYRQGIENSFRGLVHRASYLHDYETINVLFDKNYTTLQAGYRQFFPELKAYAEEQFSML